ncbi:uncharacterized protein CTRU02_214737 [Colletotrichum truncatum]|uniref:Uncharacterized protein n=1 Tax=Colletotrichum truncatum TaxID=5467 RepID=A0ACC3YGY2_COLTU|nr:uncharacterized protein CTRU02_09684 [Colletotrichum truncatum]KAF6788366.1 hypothetical protein CTRU02_09684 [Colletotrichum truncatum]
MRFSIFATVTYAVGTYAWAQAADGRWIANNQVYNIRGSQVHEACTRRNTDEILAAVPCEYWTDGRGHTTTGTCRVNINQVACI